MYVRVRVFLDQRALDLAEPLLHDRQPFLVAAHLDIRGTGSIVERSQNFRLHVAHGFDQVILHPIHTFL
jgi:hypothetical protein